MPCVVASSTVSPAPHPLRLEPLPQQRDGEVGRPATTADVQWGRPIFRAPSLPTFHQTNSELPCFVNFRSKTAGPRTAR
jgi:hypothetical protein